MNFSWQGSLEHSSGVFWWCPGGFLWCVAVFPAAWEDPRQSAQFKMAGENSQSQVASVAWSSPRMCLWSCFLMGIGWIIGSFDIFLRASSASNVWSFLVCFVGRNLLCPTWCLIGCWKVAALPTHLPVEQKQLNNNWNKRNAQFAMCMILSTKLWSLCEVLCCRMCLIAVKPITRSGKRSLLAPWRWKQSTLWTT